MTVSRTLLVARCASCHGRFLPRPGPCPRCGSREVAPFAIPPAGRVLAAVELMSPSAGWTSPHRLALVQLAQSVRVLALAPEPLPAVGAEVTIERDGEKYRIVPPSAERPA
ncbi:MAG TPA: hypothetical protein VIZ68_03370 [Thermoplasmata archaeon]